MTLGKLQEDHPEATSLIDWHIDQKINWWTRYIKDCGYLNQERRDVFLKDINNIWSRRVDSIYPSTDGELEGKIIYKDKEYPLPEHFLSICTCHRKFKLCLECLITFLRRYELFRFDVLSSLGGIEGKINFQKSTFNISWMSRTYYQSFQSIPILKLVLFID